MAKTCFVIGPIGEPGSPIRAEADDFMKYIVSPCPALEECGYGEPVRADQLSEPGRITSQIIKLLLDADLVIADLTANNANVYYELSLRHAIGKPAIHMAIDGTPLSFDVRDNRTIFFAMHSRFAERAREELANQIRRVHEKGYKATNPITETAEIIKLEQSTDPDKNALGVLMAMVAGLSNDVKSLQTSLRDVREVQYQQAANTNPLNLVGTLSPQDVVRVLRLPSSSLAAGSTFGTLGTAGPIYRGGLLGEHFGPNAMAERPDEVTTKSEEHQPKKGPKAS